MTLIMTLLHISAKYVTVRFFSKHFCKYFVNLEHLCHVTETADDVMCRCAAEPPYNDVCGLQ